MVVEFCDASCEEEVSKEVDILGSELILILQVNIDEVVLTNQPDGKTKKSVRYWLSHNMTWQNTF